MTPLKTFRLSLARAFASGAMLLAGLAHAHPGDHGHDLWQAVMHMLSEPDHLAGIALVILVASFGLNRLRKSAAVRAERARRP